MRGLLHCGLIAVAFGLAARWSGETWNLFALVNVIGGALAFAVGMLQALPRLRAATAPAFQGILARGLARIAGAVFFAFGLVWAGTAANLQLDWTFERKFALSPAVVTALEELSEEGRLRAVHYSEDFDPRTRATRLLLQTMANTGKLELEERRLEDHPEDEDYFAIGSSDTVVVQRLDENGLVRRFETVERPTEGTLFEALFQLREIDGGLIYVARGAGEGDLENTSDIGFSGLAAALATEGYRVAQFVGAAVEEIPEDADALLWIAPERVLRPETLDAVDRYLTGGGRFIAFLEPGQQTGLEKLLARWGLESPNKLVIDPASGPIAGDPPGVNPLVYNYTRTHPVGATLGADRMTFFPGARSFTPRKPEVEDKIQPVAYASPRAWLHSDVTLIERGEDPGAPNGARQDYWPVVVTGAYQRAEQSTRIVAFGDADLASNRFLRTLYNLDLVMNAIHWALEQQPAITLRPKTGISGRMQFPIPLQNTLTIFQSLGLVLPELLLLAGAMVWVRSRHA